MVTSDRGALVWTAPMAKQVSQIPMFLCSLALFGLGGMIGYAIIDVIRPTRHSWSTPGLWIAIGMVTFFFSFGAWVYYCAVTYARPLGIQFFQHGYEMGEGRKRAFVKYKDLEMLNLMVANAPNSSDKAVQALRAVASVVAMNPAGIGRALGQMAEEPVYSELFLKPRDNAVLQFQLTQRDHDTLAPLFQRS